MSIMEKTLNCMIPPVKNKPLFHINSSIHPTDKLEIGYVEDQSTGTFSRDSEVACADPNCLQCHENNLRVCLECSSG